MMRHVLRLTWNRKRQNLLLLAEILAAFLVAVGVGVTGLQLIHNARQPLGYAADHVWVISISAKETEGDIKARERDRWQQIMAELRDMPQVAAVAACFAPPYSVWSWESSLELEDGRRIPTYLINRASDDLPAVLAMRLAAGRWFSKADDGANADPVVINARLARELFGDAPAVGRMIPERVRGEGRTRPSRVVGVIDHFRQMGEYAAPGFYLFRRISLDEDPATLELPQTALIRVRPGTTAAFEEPLLRRLQQIAPAWSFSVTTTEAMRHNTVRAYLMPIGIFGTVAAFLLLMVALGLTGVLWQAVTRRTAEFGVRRAQGATGARIGRQVLAEVLGLAACAMVIGLVIVAQIPLLPLPREMMVVPRGVFVAGVASAALLVTAVAVVSAWYPSRLATRIAPAEALHYE